DRRASGGQRPARARDRGAGAAEAAFRGTNRGHRSRRRARPAARAARGGQGPVSVLVFIEQREGRLRSVSNEALGEANRVRASVGGEVVGVCPCAADPGCAGLGDAGADRTLVATNPAFGLYDSAGYTAALLAAIEKLKPAVVLFPASAMGK